MRDRTLRALPRQGEMDFQTSQEDRALEERENDGLDETMRVMRGVAPDDALRSLFRPFGKP